MVEGGICDCLIYFNNKCPFISAEVANYSKNTGHVLCFKKIAPATPAVLIGVRSS